MATIELSNNKEIKLLKLHEAVRYKLAAAISDSEYYLDDVFDDLSNEELALLAAKVNNKLNRRINPTFDFWLYRNSRGRYQI